MSFSAILFSAFYTFSPTTLNQKGIVVRLKADLEFKKKNNSQVPHAILDKLCVPRVFLLSLYKNGAQRVPYSALVHYKTWETCLCMEEK